MKSERLKSERSRLGLSQNEFAEACGVKNIAQSNYERGIRTPSADYLEKAAALGVDVAYVLTGVSTSASNDDESDLIAIKDYRSIKVSAGFGGFNEEPYDVPETLIEKAWLNARGLKAKDCAMFKVSGDSMTPTLSNGDDIIINQAEKQLKDGQIFVLNHQGTMWVKKVQLAFAGVELLSDNKDYKAIVLTQEEANSLNVIGRVVRSIKEF